MNYKVLNTSVKDNTPNHHNYHHHKKKGQRRNVKHDEGPNQVSAPEDSTVWEWKDKYHQVCIENEKLETQVAELVQELETYRTNSSSSSSTPQHHHHEKESEGQNEESKSNIIKTTPACTVGTNKTNQISSTDTTSKQMIIGGINNNWSKICQKKRIYREEHDCIRELQRRYATLQKDYKALQGKYTYSVQGIKKYKQQLVNLKRRLNTYGGGGGRGVDVRAKGGGGCKRGVGGDKPNTKNLNNDIHRLKERLLDTEHEVNSLRNENVHLKDSIDKLEHQEQHIQSLDNETAASLHAELQQTRTNLKLLHEQYNGLESKSIAQSQIHKESLNKLLECNAYIQELHNAIESLRNVGNVASSEAFKAKEQREQVQELTEQNMFLEGQLTKLYEVPLIREDENDTEKLMQQIIDLEQRNTNQLKQIDILEYENKENEGDMKSLSEKYNDVKDLYEDLELKMQEQQCSKSCERDQQISMKAIQCSLGTIDHWDDDEDGYAIDTSREEQKDPEGKREHSKVHKEVLEKEAVKRKKLEKKLADANAKVEDLKLHLTLATSEHELTAQLRLHRIRELEEWIQMCSEQGESTILPIYDLLDMKTDENQIEVFIHSAEFPCTLANNHTRSIVVLDFLNYESQVSSIQIGPQPCFNFSTNYRLKMDLFTIQQICARCLILEFYYVSDNAEIEIKARASFPVKDLLLIPTNERSPARHRIDLEFIDSDAVSVTGYVDLTIALKRPLHLINIVNKKNGMCDTMCHLFNNNREKHFIVTLNQVTGLDTSRQNCHLYVHYQLLGFSDTRTNKVPYSDEHGANLQHEMTFPLITSDVLMERMKEEQCLFSLFLCKQEGNKLNEGSYVFHGAGRIDLSHLAHGESVETVIKMKDEDELIVASLSARVEWMDQHNRFIDFV